jgi:hypothetical protein
MSVKKIFDYCDELIGADLLDERGTKKLQKAKEEAKRNMARLYFVLDDLAGADLLPEGDEENGFENCEDILGLFDF